MDVEIGRLVERLRSLGLDRKTALVFTSDHGEEFHEHGRSFHGQSVYGEMNNMPLILWAPGAVGAGLTVEETVQTVDLMPTLLELSGIAVPAGVQGRSLVPLLSPGSGEPGTARARGRDARPAISEKAETKEFGAPPPRDTAADAIVVGHWKLIHNTKRPDGKAEFELYDHARDPLDAHDVAAAHPEEVARLSKMLQGWRRMAAAARLKPDTETSQTMSKEDLERLRSLGYIQ
jgi:arylsulfatase A-like enzyme